MVHSPAAWLAVLALALLGALSPARGHAGSLEPEAPAESSLAAEPRTFGTSAITSHTLQAFAFTGAAAADVASLAPFGPASRFCTSLCTLGAPLLLPAGARVTAVELDGCDTSAVGGFTLTLFRAGKFESGTSLKRRAALWKRNPQMRATATTDVMPATFTAASAAHSSARHRPRTRAYCATFRSGTKSSRTTTFWPSSERTKSTNVFTAPCGSPGT